jgi:hypothetical protein
VSSKGTGATPSIGNLHSAVVDHEVLGSPPAWINGIGPPYHCGVFVAKDAVGRNIYECIRCKQCTFLSYYLPSYRYWRSSTPCPKEQTDPDVPQTEDVVNDGRLTFTPKTDARSNNSRTISRRS